MVTCASVIGNHCVHRAYGLNLFEREGAVIGCNECVRPQCRFNQCLKFGLCRRGEVVKRVEVQNHQFFTARALMEPVHLIQNIPFYVSSGSYVVNQLKAFLLCVCLRVKFHAQIQNANASNQLVEGRVVLAGSIRGGIKRLQVNAGVMSAWQYKVLNS